jgi:pyruvate/2-oxoglutarate dehydrogenase complex dihydrolipoamide acyltransferase (E2) component
MLCRLKSASSKRFSAYSDMTNLYVPQHIPNDESAVLVEWSVGNGEWVEADRIVCILEFSKATFDLPATEAGYLFHLRRPGDEVAVGAPLGYLSPTKEPVTEAARPDAAPGTPPASGPGKPTRKAAELMAAHGFTADLFPGLEIIREQDVRDRIAAQPAVPAGDWTAVPHSIRQKRLIRTITESHAAIPHSWVTLALDHSAVQQRIDAIREKTQSLISITDLLIFAVSRAVAECPAMNACFAETETRLFNKVNVGIAMNQDNGDLLVPVVAGADSLSLIQIAGRARQLQKKALRNTLAPEDMMGGTVTVTSLAGTGVVNVSPLIVPGQSCIVAVGDPVGIGGSAVRFLTAGFDHRVMNGNAAAKCLTVIDRIMRDDIHAAD